MRVRIEAGDGSQSRFKVVDAVTGERVGRVEAAVLEVNLTLSSLKLQIAGEERSLVGRQDAELGFIFE